MTSLEKAINLGYLFLTLKPQKRHINTCTTFCCMYWYVSIYSEGCFWPQYMYPKLSPFKGYCWCPLGKLSHLGLEQLCTNILTVFFGLVPNQKFLSLCRAIVFCFVLVHTQVRWVRSCYFVIYTINKQHFIWTSVLDCLIGLLSFLD